MQNCYEYKCIKSKIRRYRRNCIKLLYVNGSRQNEVCQMTGNQNYSIYGSLGMWMEESTCSQRHKTSAYNVLQDLDKT